MTDAMNLKPQDPALHALRQLQDALVARRAARHVHTMTLLGHQPAAGFHRPRHGVIPGASPIEVEAADARLQAILGQARVLLSRDA